MSLLLRGGMLGLGLSIPEVAVRGGGVAWTPALLGSALAGWWDLSDASTVHTSSGVITSVDDKSGNSHAMTASGSQRPAYGATAFQSHSPGMTLDGVDDWLTAANVSMGTNKFSAFCFGQYTLTDAFAQIAMSFGGTNQSTSAGFYLSNGGSPASLQVKRNNVSTVFVDSPSLRTQGGVYLRMGAVWDGSNVNVYRDGRSIVSAADASGNLSASSTFVWGARSDGLYWPGAMSELVITNRDLTAAEIAKLDTYFLRHWTRVVVAEGDSVTWAPPQNGNVSFAYRYIPNASPQAFVMNMGTPGISFNNISTDIFQRASTVIDPCIPTDKRGRQYVLTVLTLNNLGGATNSAADVTAQYGVYAAARKAAGYNKVVWCTPLSRTDAQANDTMRAAILAIMRTPGWAAANNIDAICDFAADSIMGVDAAPTVNPTYFVDQVHPNAAGHARLEPIYRAAINAV